MARILLAILLTTGGAVAGAEPPPPPGDITARAEYTLKTARTRDPVLGGPRDKVSVSVWIPDGVKTVRGGSATRSRRATTWANTGKPRAGTGSLPTFKSTSTR